MKKKLLLACIMSIVLMFGLVPNIAANNGHAHEHSCGHDCVHKITADGEYATILYSTTSRMAVGGVAENPVDGVVANQLLDGEFATILYSTTSRIAYDAIVDNPLRRDGTIDHMMRCGGAIHISDNDFHTFDIVTGRCVQIIRITTNTCTLCWASRSFSTVLRGCGSLHR